MYIHVTHTRDFLVYIHVHAHVIPHMHSRCMYVCSIHVNHELPQDETGTSVKYKGVHFGNLQSLRTQFRGAHYTLFHTTMQLTHPHTHTHILYIQ